MQEQSTFKLYLFLIIILVVIILSGIGLGFLYSALPSHYPEKNQQNCENAGGEWTEDQACLLSYKNAGEICTDGGQCISGVCFPPTLTEEQTANLSLGPLENIVGSCYPEELVTGCVAQVLKGVVSKQSMCIDD